MPIDNRLLRLDIERNSDAIYRNVKPLMEERFDEIKGEMLVAYDEHPVTEELEAGPLAHSRYIHVKDGPDGDGDGGNLFSILGFEEGEDPAGAVRDVLVEDSKINASQYSREVGPDTITFKVPIHISALSTFNNKVAEKVSLEWTDRPFTDVIEKGIPNLPGYLFDSQRDFKGASRSGPAIQVQGKLRGGSVGPIRWISDILADFKRALTESR